MLHYVEERSYDEVAEIMNAPVGTTCTAWLGVDQ
ncbi:MAG: hypothetical protein ACE5HT_07360 [Gemmatimonadales bacterium]